MMLSDKKTCPVMKKVSNNEKPVSWNNTGIKPTGTLVMYSGALHYKSLEIKLELPTPDNLHSSK